MTAIQGGREGAVRCEMQSATSLLIKPELLGVRLPGALPLHEVPGQCCPLSWLSTASPFHGVQGLRPLVPSREAVLPGLCWVCFLLSGSWKKGRFHRGRWSPGAPSPPPALISNTQRREPGAGSGPSGCVCGFAGCRTGYSLECSNNKDTHKLKNKTRNSPSCPFPWTVCLKNPSSRLSVMSEMHVCKGQMGHLSV